MPSRTNLTLVNGGGGAGGGNGRGGNTDGGSDGGGRRFRRNPLHELLWRAIYPHAANNMEQIRERMERARGRRVTFHQTNNCLHHVRCHQYEYGWTVSHVQRGGGKMRKYFPILVDAEDYTYRVSEFQDYVKAGTISTLAEVSSKANNQAVCIEILCENSAEISRGDKRQLRAASAAFTAAAEMMKPVIERIRAS